MDLGVKLDLVQKAGSWFSMGETRIGQGREAAKKYLQENPEVRDQLEADIRKNFDKLMSTQARAAAKAAGVRPEDCTVFDDSLAACQGARAARMRVIGVYDGLFAQDEKEMRGYCDVYIKSFEELLFLKEK